LGEYLVGARRFGHAAGVVVRQDHGGGLVVQGAQDHLAWVDAGLRERASEQLFPAQPAVLAVEVEHGKHLVRPCAELQLQILAHGLRAVEDRGLGHFLRQGAARELEHRHQLGAFGGPQAFGVLQGLQRRVQ